MRGFRGVGEGGSWGRNQKDIAEGLDGGGGGSGIHYSLKI